MNNIEIHQLTTSEELLQVQLIENDVWAMPPIPLHQTYTAANNGGVILGAFAAGEIVGFSYSFAGFKNGKPYLCSHMLGILPEYQRGGLGVRMKLKQAEIARNIGYSLITWTYDPLESINAYVNIHKLGAVGAYYSEDHYGELADGLNDGLPTDRFEIEWDLTTQRKNIPHEFDETRALLISDEQLRPQLSPVFNSNWTHHDHDHWFVQIPTNFQDIKSSDLKLAKQWRYDSRNVFQSLFKNGYVATDVIYNPDIKQSFYVFTK